MSKKTTGNTTKGSGASKPAAPSKPDTPSKPGAKRRRGKGKPRELSAFNKSFTINQFILRNPMSRATYFKMRGKGHGPVELRPTRAKRGGIVLISEESEKDWRIEEAARNAALLAERNAADANHKGKE
jgi:hypothetical protein